jgi:hypothetical protein
MSELGGMLISCPLAPAWTLGHGAWRKARQEFGIAPGHQIRVFFRTQDQFRAPSAHAIG